MGVLMGPKQSLGLGGAGCFHGQAGDYGWASSDEMWPQIKQCLLNTMWAWVDGTNQRALPAPSGSWTHSHQCGSKKYSLTLILKINNRLFSLTHNSLSYCVMCKKKIKRMELYHRNTKKRKSFSLLLPKSSKMKNLLSLKRVYPWENYFERLWDIKLARSWRWSHVSEEGLLTHNRIRKN